MEMPKGWKEAKEILQQRGFASDGVPHDSDLYHIDQGLDLMKEMAEALEFYAGRKEFLHSQVSEEGVSEFAERMIFPEKRARKILEKFRNWK